VRLRKREREDEGEHARLTGNLDPADVAVRNLIFHASQKETKRNHFPSILANTLKCDVDFVLRTNQ
jgi:hypothetical protein